MSRTRVQSFSISLDGSATGEGQAADAPFGHAGHRLVDHFHVVQVPIPFGRRVRLWDGLEGLEQQYDVEAVSTPSGVTHLTFTR
jgi:hypothetical protein